ncbi:PTS IIA-like nitrogen regulatory protein PtsN [Maricurvus nonylphenolicus]|uniref:PTS sugar transporter subunit IIA n=1 Tax=Maricurvus nonylphenolicus TaxID=1008307 RepID=UPI0036F24D68
MEVQSILSPRRVLCGAQGGSKKRALETLAHHIAADIPTLNADELFSSLIARERLGSTGIGKGIAIPHCRLANCSGTLGALITLQDPIDFDAIDGEPVDIIFALLVPDEANDEHLQTLAGLAEKFSNPGYLAELRRADNNQALFDAAVGTTTVTP